MPKKIKNIDFKNKKLIVVMLVTIIVLTGLISTSVAMLIRSASSNKKDLFSTGTLIIDFDDSMGSEININPAKPISDEYGSTLDPYKFKIKNTGSLVATYEIVLTNEVITSPSGLTNTQVKDNIKYQIDDGIPKLLSSTNGNIIVLGGINPGDIVEHSLRLWIKESAGNEMQKTTYKAKVSATGKAIHKYSPKPNEPKLAEGMIPVTYDETKDVWVKADTDAEWYNYDNGMWANAVTVSDCKDKGDINQDGTLDFDDWAIIVDFTSGASTEYTEEQLFERGADLNDDGQIDDTDWMILQDLITGGNTSNEYNICGFQNTKLREYYKKASAGTEINMNDINTMWVWIPRYKYKVPSNIGSSNDVTNPPMIDVIFESGTNASGVSEQVYRLGIKDDGTNTNYYTHPAFRDGSKVYNTVPYDIGGWDKELTGMWVGKFETSGSATTPTIKPDVISLRSQNVSTQFITSLKLAGGEINSSTGEVTFSGNSTYGLTSSTDTHMMKNTEWGMVAILSQSKYGKMGNSDYTGVNKEIYINNSSSYYTGRSGGAPGSSSISSTSYGSYSYNDKVCSSSTCIGNKTVNTGQGASTTGTVYGIYDMSGGADEYTMGNWNGYSGYDSSGSGFNGPYGDESGGEKTNGISFPKSKYYDKYTKGDGSNNTMTKEKVILGDATWETARWYQDFAYFPIAESPFALRGGYYRSHTNSGAFHSNNYGGNANTIYTFRLTLIP